MERVFFGPSSGIWKNLYAEVLKSETVEYCEFVEGKGIGGKLLSHKLAHRFKVPGFPVLPD